MSMISVRLPEPIEKRLSQLAKETGRTKAYYVREAIEEHLEELEDTYTAIKRLEKPSKRWTLKELESGSDLES